jgi:hypothetical protein
MMSPAAAVLAFVAMIASGFWAYRENYQTQDALRHLHDVQADITALREALGVQRAEWAYLNRPDRLRDLVDLNFDRLGLMPMDPSQFGSAAQVTYPALLPSTPNLTDAVDVGGTVEGGNL